MKWDNVIDFIHVERCLVVIIGVYENTLFTELILKDSKKEIAAQ